MIKVYYLEIEKDIATNTEKVRGFDYIHNAVLEGTERSDIRKLIMDTSAEEGIALSALAIEVRDPTPEETARFMLLPSFPPVLDLAKEITELQQRMEMLEKRRVI